MSYKALYRTYRPKKFSDVKGQEHITKTLGNVIALKRISHAYLFSGPRGTGKTSVAKIFASVLNCIDLDENLNPCLKCHGCLDSFAKSPLDIIEMDAASNNGIDEIREIRDNINYAPSKSQYKIYIIDEVHMLSKAAFNALLKTLEEPPQHIIFILATTEPHKIPITILSRTQRFNFRKINDDVIFNHLDEICNKQNYSFEPSALKLIAKISKGSLRDGLSILDQTAAFSNNNISFLSVSQIFGVIPIKTQIEIINSAFIGKSENLLNNIDNILNNGTDLKITTESFIDIIKDYIIFRKTNNIKLLSSIGEDDVSMLQIDVSYAYVVLDIFVELLSNLAYSDTPEQHFELAMLKILNINNKKSNKGQRKPIEEDIVDSKESMIKIKKQESILTEINNEEISKPKAQEELISSIPEFSPIPESDILNKDFKAIEIEGLSQTIETKTSKNEEEYFKTGEIENTKNNNLNNEHPFETGVKKIPKKEIVEELEGDNYNDILSMFEIQETTVQDDTKEYIVFSIDELLNLLIQTNPELHQENKII
jgi:DNA polymerase-3 subunit gamma/tau